ncbi:hypothetical protein [Histidinibacterium aquaticum]|uniref:Uncharacterized protein n=1 Tax=Histidinibacterium aquaticum TaxID=2613962 RepID=A0A5J5GMR6_9RHOB|nr:hypothetical protein [Histidinibacterium aquaticum]KAA9008898.1 hypothetical protein F3S47_06445 [Histidinibacterium aquaticum]
MEVLGRDSAAEAYRVRAHGVTALVPDHMMSHTMALTGGHGHQTAHDWLARHARQIEETLLAYREGRPVRPPYTLLELVED